MKKANVITIPYAIPSRNTLDKLHWSKKKAQREIYEYWIVKEMVDNKIPKAFDTDRYRLHFESVKRYPVKDYDNLMGGIKLMLDALVRQRFVFDDTMKYIGTPSIKQISLTEFRRGGVYVRNLGYTGDSEHTIIIRTERKIVMENDKFNLEEILKNQGRKKRWLAEQMATTETTVSRWCKNGKIPEIKMEKIKEILGIES